MLFTRVIPALLIQNGRLVKGVRFTDHRYVGDPMNTIRIFSCKEVDELMLLDIGATKEETAISPELIERVSMECLMPLTVGGGIKTIDHVKSLLNAGAEKVCLGTIALERPAFIREVSECFGRQSIVISIDVKAMSNGDYQVMSRSGTRATGRTPCEVAREMESLGAGEILLNSIDRDGTMQGYDVPIISQVTKAVTIPVVALGGAGSVEHLKEAIHKGNADAVAAGSFFVFHGRRKAVLISFPTRRELDTVLSKNC